MSRPASATTIVLGLIGIAGGFALVGAFLPHLPWSPEAFNLRLVAFGAGAIAIAIALLRLRPAPSRLVAPLAVLTIVANVGHIAMVILALDRPRFPEPDPEFRLLADYVAAAMWLADAALGFVAWRIGGLARWAGVALGFGSLFAFSGMARLGLFDGPYGWFFAPASQIGIALNGIGWILLGLAVATRRRPRVLEAGVLTAPKET